MSTSKFAMFMKDKKAKKENGFYAPTKSLTDEDGKPLEWEFRHITPKENDELRDECMSAVPVGESGAYRPRADTSKDIREPVAASVVYPELYDAELQDSYGVTTPEDLLVEMVDDIGEYQALVAFVQEFQGFGGSFSDKVDEAKN